MGLCSTGLHFIMGLCSSIGVLQQRDVSQHDPGPGGSTEPYGIRPSRTYSGTGSARRGSRLRKTGLGSDLRALQQHTPGAECSSAGRSTGGSAEQQHLRQHLRQHLQQHRW